MEESIDILNANVCSSSLPQFFLCTGSLGSRAPSNFVCVIFYFLRMHSLHSHRDELHKRLDSAFPLPVGHDLIKHSDDHFENADLTKKGSNSLVSLLAVFSSVGTTLEALHELEHNLVFSISKAFSNFYASRETIPRRHSVLYKEFEPLSVSQCTNEFWKYVGVENLSESKRRMDQGKLYMDVYEPQIPSSQSKVNLFFVALEDIKECCYSLINLQ